MPKEQFIAFWLGYVPSGAGFGPPLGSILPSIDVVTLAFANLFPGNTVCTSFLQKSNTLDAIQAGIAQIRKRLPNTKILLSLIGTPTPPVGWNDGITDPEAFGSFCAWLYEQWDLDGFDIDNEDTETFPGDAFVAAVKAMRAKLPSGALLSMDTYLFDRDSGVIQELAGTLDWINTMAYFLDYASMVALVEQYTTVIPPAQICIGVKADVQQNQGTPVEEVKRLCAFEPKAGPKRGMMLWNVSADITSVTHQPDGTWTNTIVQNLP